ncbi:CBS domain-containing protein [Streptomyces sp. HUAS ZL42]|uniref:CBS domain-containing protein n=1 Tax=Streptomyces sp. HUAS ZL42 TaxID=3231715 RepID=UPI00345E4548
MYSRTVGEVMTREVVHARRTTPFKNLVRLLDRHRISGLPVVDHDDKVVGVVSGTDLVRAQARREGGQQGRGATAGDLMSTPAITVHPEQPVADAARVMERHGVERLPVVDEEDRLIGIATRRDLLRVFLRTDGAIRAEVIAEVLVRALALPPGAVEVRVRDGMVTLTGRVESLGDIATAVWSTWQVEGVVGVVNGLTVRVGDAGAEGQPAVDQGPNGPSGTDPATVRMI